jgi:glycosyltransferase involved in cell wall biosynthesis
MRIAVVHNLPSGGARRALLEHCRGLRARGHVVELFHPDTADEAFLPLGPVADRAHVWRSPRPPGREASLFGNLGPRGMYRSARLLRAIRRINREMAAAIDAGGFDVVLAGHDQFTHAPGALRHLRTPAAYYCQEPLRFVYEAPVGLSIPLNGGPIDRLTRWSVTGAVKGVLRPLDAGSARAARTILANSIYSHESIMRAYGRVARVVYLGVDVERFRPLGRERGDFVLTVGAMHPAKGHDFVVSALGRLPAGRRPRLVLVCDRGYGVYRQLLEAHAARCGVTLEVRERVSDDELVELYNRARLLCYAPYLEPFGLVALEAMACGTPVVAVAEGGTRESIRPDVTGVLTMRDVDAFARAVDELASDPARAARLAAAARDDVATRWTWPASAERLEQALEHCVAGAT